jgi:serine/threonine protein kinase
VGLSHLQKHDIKHTGLKSSRILLSKEGLIKVYDPLAIGQQTNEDAAITKKSTLHADLSPEQTQALQQENITPTYNPYKSDIFTLGMIMLEAGLLEYQDEECYRDEKTRIHW